MTEEQLDELREAIAGDDAELIPKMPEWWDSLTDDEKAEAIALAMSGLA